jgi:hypothetical protein
MHFIKSAEMDYFEKTEPICTLKHLSCKKFSLQKLIQYLQGNNVLDAPASNTDGFLSRDTCVSSLSWIGLFGTKWSFLHLEKSDLQEVFLWTTKLILTGKLCARCYTSFTNRFLSRDTCVSSTQLNRPIWSKKSLSLPWNT